MIIPELSIVKLFLNYPLWQKYGDLLQVNDFPKELQPLVRLLYARHDLNEEGLSYSVADLANMFFASNPSNREYMEGVFNQIEKDDSKPETTLELIEGIRVRTALQELSMKAYDASQGKGNVEDVVAFFDKLKKSETEVKEDEFSFVTTDLGELLDGAVSKVGLRWRLNLLNRSLGSLRKGDFGFLFARPETGKTTLLASEVTFMASQAVEQALGPVAWFNNEEQGSKVMLRCIQAFFGVELIELMRNRKEYERRFKDILGDKFLLLDQAQISQKMVEKVCERYKPSLIVFDQIDKIQTPANDREDLRLGSIYQWARELAKHYAPVIGVSQADGSGEGQKWLTMANVANAKTSKQAEADWILGVGKVNDAGYDAIRYLHASKNKLMGDEDSDPTLRHMRKECIIDAHLARYRDID